MKNESTPPPPKQPQPISPFGQFLMEEAKKQHELYCKIHGIKPIK